MSTEAVPRYRNSDLGHIARDQNSASNTFSFVPSSKSRIINQIPKSSKLRHLYKNKWRTN